MSSEWVLWEDTDDVVFLILLLEVLSVLIAKVVEWEEGENQEEGVAELGTHLPGWDLGRVALSVPVIGAAMQPVTIVVHVELLEVAELIKGVMLQIVHLYR